MRVRQGLASRRALSADKTHRAEGGLMAMTRRRLIPSFASRARTRGGVRRFARVDDLLGKQAVGQLKTLGACGKGLESRA